MPAILESIIAHDPLETFAVCGTATVQLMSGAGLYRQPSTFGTGLRIANTVKTLGAKKTIAVAKFVIDHGHAIDDAVLVF